MKKQDKIRFAKVMAVLAEIFDQGKEPSEFKIELYFKAMAEYEIESIENAATRIIKERVFPAFPKPGEIIQEIRGTKENQAIDAWGKVVDAVRKHGPYPSVAFGDGTIHAVIQFMGGWPATGEWLEDELKWKQREFERLYVIMQGRGSNVQYLPGIIEMKNGLGGKEPSPIMIEGAGTVALRSSPGG